jgi:hypothetical protein
VADLEKGYILCEELVQSNYIPAYMLLAQIYGWKGNFQKMMETLGKGIEKEDQNCMSSLELALENNFVQIKQFLGGLTPNNLITNKINQINSVMSGTGFMLSMKRI